MTLIANLKNDGEAEIDELYNHIRMENLKQMSENSNWNSLARKSSHEKQSYWNTKNRLDLINSVNFLRKNVPENKKAQCAARIKHLADTIECSLTSHPGGFFLKNSDITIEIGCVDENITSCKIGYWEGPLFDAVEAMQVLRNGNFSQFRNSIFEILSILPSNVSQSDRAVCKNALKSIEQLLLKEAHDSSFSSISSSKYGFFCPRSPLRPGRLYYIVEPIYVKNAEKMGKSHADLKDLEDFPFFEIAFVGLAKRARVPEVHQSGEWRNFSKANVCICLKFPTPIQMSIKTLKRLDEYVVKPSLLGKTTNIYKNMLEKLDLPSKSQKLYSNLPEGYIQHQYEIEATECLKKENSGLLVEMYIKNIDHLQDIIRILRDEYMHNKLWESILTISENGSTDCEKVAIRTILSRRSFEFVFPTTYGLVNVEISQKSDCQWQAKSLISSSGQSISDHIDEQMTKAIHRTWNIPCSLAVCTNGVNCVLTPKSENDEKNGLMTGKNGKKEVIGSAWLSRKHEEKPEKERVKKGRRKAKAEGYQRQDDSSLRCGLLMMFAEVDDFFKAPPVKPASALRAQLMASHLHHHNQHPHLGEIRRVDSTTAVFSDLEKIRMLAEADMDDDKKSSPFGGRVGNVNTPRTSLDNNNPMMMMRQGSMGGMMMNQHYHHHPNHPHMPGMPGMSPLDAARMQMKQSMGAAQAVALATHQSSAGPPNSAGAPPTPISRDMFDFPDDATLYGMGSPSSQISSSPSSQTGTGTGATRGAPKTRRPRARKPGGIQGDRTASTGNLAPPGSFSISSSPTGHPMGMPTGGRGRGRGRGSGRGGGTVGAIHQSPQHHLQHQQPPHVSPYGGGLGAIRKISAMTGGGEMDHRPMLQRSFSDYPGQQQQQQQQYPPPPQLVPHQPSPMKKPSEDSDDECDPPPPPASQQHQQHPLKITQALLQSPPNQPLTPSPLTMPPKSWQSAAGGSTDQKPEMSVLNQMLSSNAPPLLQQQQPASAQQQQQQQQQKRKGLGLEAAISKIKQQQQTPAAPATPLVTNHRASTLSDIFDDGMSPPERKPPVLDSAVQSQQQPSTTPAAPEFPKLVLKIPKVSRNSPSVDQQRQQQQQQQQLTAKQQQQQQLSTAGMPKLEKQEKVERKKRDKEKAEPKAKKRKHEASSSSSSSSSKKEREGKEPREKKSKKEKDVNPIAIMPTLSLKNFRIPKKESNEDTPPPMIKEEGAASLGTSSMPVTSRAASIQPAVVPPSSAGGDYPPPLLPPASSRQEHFFRDAPPTKKKSSAAQQQPPPYLGGPPNRRKNQGGGMPPPLPRGGYGRGGGGGMPPGGYYGGGPQQQPQVASYAQGVPPGMGPPAAGGSGSHRDHYGWGRPTQRDYHSSGYQMHSNKHDKDRMDHRDRGGGGGGQSSAAAEDIGGPESPEETLRIADE